MRGKKGVFFIAGLLCVCAGLPGDARAECIVLTSGKVIEAPIVSSDDTKIKIAYEGRDIYYKFLFIKSIEGLPPDIFLTERARAGQRSRSPYSRDVDYGLETEADTIISAIHNDLEKRFTSCEVKPAERVTEDILRGGIHAHYSLLLAEVPGDTLSSLHAHALKEFSQVVTISPYAARFYYDVVHIFSSPDDFDEMYFYYRNVLQKDSNDVHALFALGAINYSQARLEEAISCFEKVTRSCRDWAEVRSLLGLAYCSRGDFEEGKKNLREACLLFQEKGDWDEAKCIDNLLVQLP